MIQLHGESIYSMEERAKFALNLKKYNVICPASVCPK